MNHYSSSALNHERLQVLPELYKNIEMGDVTLFEKNDRLNNPEVGIETGCEIKTHTHDNSCEWFVKAVRDGESTSFFTNQLIGKTEERISQRIFIVNSCDFYKILYNF